MQWGRLLPLCNIGFGIGLGIALALPSGKAAEVPTSPAPTVSISTIADLRALSHEEARRGLPVHVKGVVTYTDDQWRTLFIQQDEAGCFVYRTNPAPRVELGQAIEIEGRTVPGYMTAIGEQSLQVIGTAPLPAATAATLEQLISGVEDSQRVRVRTVVRSMRVQYGRLILDFGEARGRFEAHVPAYDASTLPTQWLDAIVEITGVVGAQLSPQDHLIGVRLFVPTLDDIRMLTPSPRDPFDRLPQSIERLSLVNPAANLGQRLCITGVVTLATPSGKLFLEDQSGSVQVKLDTPRQRVDPGGLYLDPPATGLLQPGDRVQVIGYPALGEYAPILQEAWAKRLGPGRPASPRRVTAERALTGQHDSRLVTITGRLISRELRPMGTTMDQVLTIQSEQVIFEARLENDSALDLPVASTIALTGICAVQADEQRKPRAFRLLLRSAADATLLERPPRWSLDEAIRGLALALAVLAAAVGWLVLLRRRIRFQEERISGLRREAELQQRYRALFDSLQDVYYRADLNGITQEISPSIERLVGFSPAERIGRPTLELCADPAERDRLFAALMKDGAVIDYEMRLRHKNGGTVIVSLNARVVRNDSGQIIATEGFLRDITARKQAEQALRENQEQLNSELERRIAERTAELRQSEERFGKAFNRNPAILSILRLPEARYIDVNETFLRTYGFTREEVLGRTSIELNLWQDPADRAALFDEVRAGHRIENRESHYRTKTGEPRIVLQSLESIMLGGDQCLLSVGQDITDNKRVQAALAEQEAHTRLIVDNALDAVITIDTAGIIRGWNPQAEIIFGWTKDEVMGRELADTLIPPHYRQGHRRGLQRYLETGEGPVLNRRIELTALRKSGQEFPAELAITALRVGSGYAFSAFVRDITERRRAEEELLRALEREKELGKLKSNFVTMVSHEFRTPLGIIMSSEEILDRYFDRLTPEKRHEQLQAIHNAVKRMAEMMEEVLLLGRVEAGKMECRPVSLDLPAFLRSLIEELQAATAQRCPIEFEPGPLPGPIAADEGLLRHIFTNLLSNAIKYSPAGQAVHFTVRSERGHAIFTIEDHGLGIPEADQQWMFKAFHRGGNVGNLPGTGLGLTIVKRCVELHGGKIKFHSTTGLGTTFIVTLPLTDAPVEIGTETAFFMNRP
jgi:PAS domain S-box-containing protein